MKLNRIVALLLALVMLLACSAMAEGDAHETTITDMIGREVTIIPGSYTRVVCIGAGALRMYSYIGDTALLCGVEDIDNTSLEDRPKMFDSVARPYVIAYGDVFAALDSCGVGGPNAQAAEAEVRLNNARLDLARYEALLQDGAIPEQQATTQAATVRSYEAALAANEASIKLAMENLADTEIYAPMSGQLGVDDVAVGTFVTAGQTTLVTLGSPDPIFAQFSISEADYLHFMTVQNMQSEHNPIDVTITLADGKEYPFEGRIVEVDRELANSTGSLIMKAIFPNPGGLLMPGMFARVKLTGEIIPNAILVPQRAVQQLLGKSFVMVVGKDGKSEARTVELGDQVGSYFVVTKGINTNDTVIVEGLTNLREGVELDVRTVTPGEMGFTLSEVTSTYNADAGLGAPSSNPNAPDNLRGK